MFSNLKALFDGVDLAPHGICLLWRPELIWLHVVSDALIASAYFSIPLVLALFVTKRTDVAFGWVFWAFATFILACGTTHVFGIWTLFYPDYAAEGLVKAITAIASVLTALGLVPLLPKALAIPSPAQLRQANEALHAQIREREAAVIALQREQTERARTEGMLRQSQKMEAVGQLTAGIAHDFNNVLTVVCGSLEHAKRFVGDQPQLRRALDMAEAGADRAALLIERLMAFGRRQPLSPRIANPRDVMDTTIDTLRRTIGGRIRIAEEFSSQPWPVRIDAHELENALLNLALNSRDAMPAGGDITIATRNVPGEDAIVAEAGLPPGEYLEIAVSDTGEGMTADVVAKAFEPFFTTKPVGSGTGLGLSQVYGFARQSGGTAIIESVFGAGATVRMLLPRAPRVEAQAGPAPAAGVAFAPIPQPI
jgi:signal transduction histidine kinase